MPTPEDERASSPTHNGCELGKGSALHSHETVEVFIPLTGRWSVYWGDEGENEVILEQGDVISVPTGVMPAVAITTLSQLRSHDSFRSS